ncbi:MAG: putative transcriptional regulator, CopG family [Patescibacteria group bacterium]|nr:putative transcriptional regulator, CopG family [Patescibacteria group bacterium]
MSTQTINISLPEELVKKIDVAAKAEYASRSDYIRQALVGRLKATEMQSRADNWLLLEALSEDVAIKAQALGYDTDEDFVRAVKTIRQKQKTQK